MTSATIKLSSENVKINQNLQISWDIKGNIPDNSTCLLYAEGPFSSGRISYNKCNENKTSWRVNDLTNDDISRPIRPGKYIIKLYIYDGEFCDTAMCTADDSETKFLFSTVSEEFSIN